MPMKAGPMTHQCVDIRSLLLQIPPMSGRLAKQLFKASSVLRAGKEFTTPYVSKQFKPKPGFSAWFYETFMKKTSTYATTVVVGAIVMDYAYQTMWDKIWVWNNQGKLYADVLRDFPKIPPNCDVDEEESSDE